MNRLVLIFILITAFFSCREHNNSKQDEAANTNNIENTGEHPKGIAKVDNNPALIKTILNQHSVETFHISSKTDNIITGKKGVVLFLPANAFDIKSDSTDITIQLEEYSTIADMFLAGLATTSNGQVLETDCIINIKAIAGNEEIKLRPNANIVIHFPKKNTVKKMDLVRGVAARTGVYWLRDTTSQLSLKLNGMQFSWQNPPPAKGATGYKKLIDYLKSELTLAFKSFDEKTKQLCNNKSFTFNLKVNKSGKAIEYQPMGISDDFEKKVMKVFTGNLPSMEPYSQDIAVKFSAKPEYIELPRYVNDKEYNNAFKEKHSNNKSFHIKNNEKNYFIFYCSKLGWINCGRYPDTKTPKANLVVTVDPKYKTEVKVVMRDFEGIAGYSSLKENIFSFNNIPSKQKIKILVVQYRDDQPYYAIKESNTSNETESKFDFKMMVLAELKEELETLNQGM